MKDWGEGDMTPSKRDPITQPIHYTRGRIEVSHAIELLGLGFVQGNVVKYICRFKDKGGRECLLKAKQYITMMLDNYEEWYGDNDHREHS